MAFECHETDEEMDETSYAAGSVLKSKHMDIPMIFCSIHHSHPGSQVLAYGRLSERTMEPSCV